MRRQAVEHHSAVCRHGREAAQSAFRFGAEAAESVDQRKIHHSFRLLSSDTLGDRLALSLVQPDLEACAMQFDRLRRNARREVNLVRRLRGGDTLAAAIAQTPASILALTPPSFMMRQEALSQALAN